MTTAAGEILMCALQLEICLLIVIKKPNSPVVGVMAVMAVRAQCRLVLIIFLMASVAV